ncbi:MAG: FmdB family zinc ribbon protein, partial [Desulfovibrionales bacterium]
SPDTPGESSSNTPTIGGNMPLFDIVCTKCGFTGEVLIPTGPSSVTCPECGGGVEKQLSAPSTLSGKTPKSRPGHGDTACCGSSPSQAGCAGPGSCCGKV